MFRFKNKTIIILSPEKWGKMHISKHHYAIELAQKGNMVYFITHNRNIKGITSIKSGYENLTVIEYSTFFPYSLKFHFRVLFDFLMKFQIKKLLKKIAKLIDVVWCFDINIYSNLNYFNAGIKIYHPVDNIFGTNQTKLLKTSDFVFSVSNVIINKMRKIYPGKEYLFINHGLSDLFIDKNKYEYENTFSKPIYAYFVGNVLLASLDRENVKKLINENDNVHFIFIGSYNYTESNIGGTNDKGTIDFVSYLKTQKNVTLKGSMHPQKVVVEIKKADVLLVLIDPQKDINKGSNSHKTMEYLSTGKVIVSNHLSTYADKRYLIEMLDEMHNEKLPALFKKVINNLQYYNSPDLQQKRIDYALDNTYAKQINRIENYISTVNKKHTGTLCKNC